MMSVVVLGSWLGFDMACTADVGAGLSSGELDGILTDRTL